MINTSHNDRVQAALGLPERPAGFRSELKIQGGQVHVELDAKAKRRGGYIMTAVLLLAMGLFIFYAYLSEWQLTSKSLDNAVLVVAGLSALTIPFFSRRYTAPETLHASLIGIKFELPSRWKEGNLRPVEEVRVEVQEREGVPGLLIADGSQEYFVGRGLALQELHWIRKAVRIALDDQVPIFTTTLPPSA